MIRFIIYFMGYIDLRLWLVGGWVGVWNIRGLASDRNQFKSS